MYKQRVSVNSMSEPEFDVAACVQRVRAKDEDAARLLMRHLYPLVLKLVRAHLPQRTSEEDLVQTAFVKMFANIDQYSGSVPLEHWVSRITVNTCINQLRAEKRRPELRWSDLDEDQQFVVQTIATSSDSLPEAESSHAREIVEKLLERLEPADRVLLTLLHLEERSGEEVARMMGWSHTRVRVRGFRARQKLKREFEKLMNESKYESR